MNLLQHHLVEHQRFVRFERERLTTAERQVLKLLAVSGLPHKEVANIVGLSPKSVERLVANIAHKYRCAYYPDEQQASNRRILNQAACYYYLAELLAEPQEA
jgi:FixJ family two-component response regulator